MGHALCPVPVGGTAPGRVCWFALRSLCYSSSGWSPTHFNKSPAAPGVLVVLCTPPEPCQSCALVVFCCAAAEGIISSAGLDPSCHRFWCKSTKKSSGRQRCQCLPATEPPVWRESLLLPPLQAALCLGGFMLGIESCLFCAAL